MVPQAPVGSEGDSREDGNKKEDRERGIKRFIHERRTVSYPTAFAAVIYFKL